MITKLVAFRVSTDLYESFQEACSSKRTTVSEELRHFMKDYLHPSSQSKDAATNEAEDGKEFDDEQLSILEGRITKVEDRIEKLDEPLGDIFNQLENIERILPQAGGVGIEDESEPVPDEEQKEDPEKKDEGLGWPFNLFH
jgi:hypothetical protein